MRLSLRNLAIGALAMMAGMPTAHSDGCSGTVNETLGTLACAPQCTTQCGNMTVNTTSGQGLICICNGVGFTGCCTVAMLAGGLAARGESACSGSRAHAATGIPAG